MIPFGQLLPFANGQNQRNERQQYSDYRRSLEYDDLPQFGLTGQSKSKFNSARKAAFGSVIELSLSSIGRHQLAKIQRQSRRLKLQLMVY
jgi:hypothetical protein